MAAKKKTTKTSPSKKKPAAAAAAPKKAPPRKPGPKSRDITLTYLHDAGPQPSPADIKQTWDLSLFGKPLGARSFVAYYADILFPELTLQNVSTLESAAPPAPSQDPKDQKKNVEERLEGFGKKAQNFGGDFLESMIEKDRLDGAYQGSPIEHTLKNAAVSQINQFVTASAAALEPENNESLDLIKERFLKDELGSGSGRYVLITHGLGGLLAYLSLCSFEELKIQIDSWISLGSPFDNPFIQKYLKGPLEIPNCVGQWHNIVLTNDPITLDPHKGKGFPKSENFHHYQVEGEAAYQREQLDAHAAERYLSVPKVRELVIELLPPNFDIALANLVIAFDVAKEINSSPLPLPVLIEIDAKSEGATLDEKRNVLIRHIKAAGRNRDNLNIDPLKRYIAADLTGSEIRRLTRRSRDLKISRVWKNSEKRSLIDVSVRTVQAEAARTSYNSAGQDITWAVLDTGVAAAHPHFQNHENIVHYHDCTQFGEGPLEVMGADRIDTEGHGTHVAAIIAGEGRRDGNPSEQSNPDVLSIAPRTRLHVYKVLEGPAGRDSWIIKALDHIAEANDNAPELVVHGVNLSLGGPFDPEVYGCGHSPICRELRRLWRQGVVVCIAAGNSGQIEVQSHDTSQNINLGLSIGDPANLDDAIVVGSVHRRRPHQYGVSYYSSRGPTADGRCKPDLVAPGEKILSANAKGFTGNASQHYVRMSGTSQACPHVSGIIAAFLSVRTEFIGYPDRVKQILLKNCTDLGRDRYHQGAGLPNLVKMLTNT